MRDRGYAWDRCESVERINPNVGGVRGTEISYDHPQNFAYNEASFGKEWFFWSDDVN